MALLTERQQQARALSDELSNLGAFVISPLPLDNNAKLRIQVLENCNKNRIFQAIADWGFGVPVFVTMLPRVTHVGMAIAAVYEIPIPKAQQPIVDERRIPDFERASNEKMSKDVQAILDDWHGKKKQQKR
jgi:hypothetical protein